MVRLEILKKKSELFKNNKFTFQYGQIRNNRTYVIQMEGRQIYIPVWLDQKSATRGEIAHYLKNLHSSMVRLEIRRNWRNTEIF